jgi:hypothetical protein
LKDKIEKSRLMSMAVLEKTRTVFNKIQEIDFKLIKKAIIF